ncbi:MAG: hypothetical protein AAF735_04630 [Myxococcota bacterium]
MFSLIASSCDNNEQENDVRDDVTGDLPPEPSRPNPAPENRPPTIVLSAPDSTFIGQTVRVELTGSVDPEGDVFTADLTQSRGPDVSIVKVSDRLFEVTGDVPGSALLQVTLTDSKSVRVSDTFTLEIVNRDPAVEPIPDQRVVGGQSFRFELEAHDPDGHNLSFDWRQLSGADVLAGVASDTSTLAFVAPLNEEVLEFEVEVSDGFVRIVAQLTVIVTSRALIANAGADLTVNGGELVHVVAAGWTQAGDATYRWTQTEGPALKLGTVEHGHLMFTAPELGGELRFELTVEDGDSITSDEVSMSVLSFEGELAETPARPFVDTITLTPEPFLDFEAIGDRVVAINEEYIWLVDVSSADARIVDVQESFGLSGTTVLPSLSGRLHRQADGLYWIDSSRQLRTASVQNDSIVHEHVHDTEAANAVTVARWRDIAYVVYYANGVGNDVVALDVSRSPFQELARTTLESSFGSFRVAAANANQLILSTAAGGSVFDVSKVELGEISLVDSQYFHSFMTSVRGIDDDGFVLANYGEVFLVRSGSVVDTLDGIGFDGQRGFLDVGNGRLMLTSPRSSPHFFSIEESALLPVVRTSVAGSSGRIAITDRGGFVQIGPSAVARVSSTEELSISSLSSFEEPSSRHLEFDRSRDELFVTGGLGTVVYNVSHPESPTRVRGLRASGLSAMTLIDELLVIMDGWSLMTVSDSRLDDARPLLAVKSAEDDRLDEELGLLHPVAELELDDCRLNPSVVATRDRLIVGCQGTPSRSLLVDISEPTEPQILDESPRLFSAVAIRDGVLYNVSDGSLTLFSIDREFVELSSIPLSPGYVSQAVQYGDYLALPFYNPNDRDRQYVARFDISDPRKPLTEPVLVLPEPEIGNTVTLGDQAFSAAGGRLEIWNHSEPKRPNALARFEPAGTFVSAALGRSLVFAAEGGDTGVIKTFSFEPVRFEKRFATAAQGTTLELDVWHRGFSGEPAVLCEVSGGECSVSDSIRERSTIRWSLPNEPGDYEIVVIVGSASGFARAHERVRVGESAASDSGATNAKTETE